MRKFKVGDKVEIVSRGIEKGLIGKIIMIETNSIYPYIVTFDKSVNLMHGFLHTADAIRKRGFDPDKCYFYSDTELKLVEEEKMENVKSLLKSGDIVVLRYGHKAKAFLDYETAYYGKGIFAYMDTNDFMPLSSYKNSLFAKSGNDCYAIDKIYHPKSDSHLMSTNLDDYELVWERKETKEMTIEEIEKELKLPAGSLRIKKEDK